MRRLLTAATTACLGAFCACTPPPVADGGTGAGTGNGGGSAVSDGGKYTLYALDPAAPGRDFMAMAIDPVAEKVGVAYYTATNRMVNLPIGDGGTPMNWGILELKYVEWEKGQLKPVQKIADTQVNIGLSVAFQANGEPAVAYLGGGQDDTAGWPQSDAVIAYRSGGSTWSEERVVQRSAQIPCGNPVSDGDNPAAVVIGLWPALAFIGDQAFLAFRDVHNGQYPMQDWQGSDLKYASGTRGAWNYACVVAGGNDKNAWGARNAVAKTTDDTLGYVFDQAFDGAKSTGKNVHFMLRKPDGTFTPRTQLFATGDNGSGATVAWDTMLGWGVAVTDVSVGTPQLSYRRGAVNANTGAITWAAERSVYQSGTGGWYPSLAFDPVNHEPAIAFYVCSARAGVGDLSGCDPEFDELRVAQLFGNGTEWRSDVVDAAGAYLPKLGFFASGKRAVAYRDPRSGAVKLAVER